MSEEQYDRVRVMRDLERISITHRASRLGDDLLHAVVKRNAAIKLVRDTGNVIERAHVEHRAAQDALESAHKELDGIMDRFDDLAEELRKATEVVSKQDDTVIQ